MASTSTTRLGLEKQGTGDNNNSWGAKLNASGLDLIDAAIAGMASYTLSGTKNLTSTNYVANEARMPFQNITGGTGGTVTVPSKEGRWVFRNGTTGDVIVTTGSGAAVTLQASDIAVLSCDGTNVYAGITKSYVDGAIADAAFGGVTLGSGVAAMLASFTSANIRAACTDETGSGGSLVFSASPALTGTPTVPTATAGTNTTQAASTAFVTAAVTATGAITASSTTTLTNKNVSLADNTVVGTTAQFNTALSDGDFMTLAGTETGTNKSFTTPVLTGTASGTTAGRLGYSSGALSFGDGSAQRTVVTTNNTQTLTGKTVDLASNTLTGTKAQFNTALSDGDFATLAGTETLTGKSVDLGSNTLTGTLAQFNTALSGADFASLAGAETLTNKTVALGSNTVTGTKAQFNTACTDGDFVYTDAIGSSVQGYDADLAAIAALSTQTFGRSLLTQASAGAALSTLGFTYTANANGQAIGFTIGSHPFLIQWGIGTTGTGFGGPDGWSSSYTFPVTFGTGIPIIVASSNETRPTAADGNAVSAKLVSASQYQLGSDDQAVVACWIAIGPG